VYTSRAGDIVIDRLSCQELGLIDKAMDDSMTGSVAALLSDSLRTQRAVTVLVEYIHQFKDTDATKMNTSGKMKGAASSVRLTSLALAFLASAATGRYCQPHRRHYC